MRSTICYLTAVAVLWLISQLAAALPEDADRTIDPNLAGFLYAQGIYKTVYGKFRLLPDQETKSVPDDEFKIPEDSSGNSKVVHDWIQTESDSIPIGILFDD